MKNIPCPLRPIALAIAMLLASLFGANTLCAAGGDLYLTELTYGLVEQASQSANGPGVGEGDFATSLKSPYGLAFDKAGNLLWMKATPATS